MSTNMIRRFINLWPPLLFSGIRVKSVAEKLASCRGRIAAAVVEQKRGRHYVRRQPVRDE